MIHSAGFPQKGQAVAKRNRLPTYREHKQSGQAVVTLPNQGGKRHDVLLGPFNSPESKSEYERVLVRWLESKKGLAIVPVAPDITITELIDKYLQHAEVYYRRADRSPTLEGDHFRYSLRPLNHLWGGHVAAEFGPKALIAVRQLMIDGYEHPRYGPQAALSRNTVNQRVKRIRRMFKWAVEKEILPSSVWHGLAAVSGLKRGRSDAKETDPVEAVSRAIVNDTLPLLSPMLADMVCLQLETGMRPGELVAMRSSQIDMTGQVWLYQPATHKTAHLGHIRIVPIGPKGQDVIRRNIVPNIDAPLFSPARNTELRRQASGRPGKPKCSRLK